MAGILPSASFVVAIPALLQGFHTDQAEGQLVMTVFMITNTIAMLPTPWLLRHVGMRNCFLWTMALLVLTSILGALSPNFAFLVVVRAAQGAGAGTLMPMSSIVIMRLFQPAQRGRAAGIIGLVVTLGPALAPTIGGLMVDHWGWRSVSLLPLPLCLIAWVAAMRYLPARTAAERHGFDARGMLLLSLFTLAWLGALSNLHAAARYWLLAFLVVLLGSVQAFVTHARRHRTPLISLQILKRIRVAMGAVLCFVLGFYSYGAAYIVPLYFQLTRHLSATRAGVALMPGTLALALSSPLAGFLCESFSARQIMSIGMIVMAASWLALGAFSEHCSYAEVVGIVVVSRVGFALVNTPLTQTVLRDLSSTAVGQAAAVLGYVRQLGGVCGVSALAVYVEWRAARAGLGASALGRAYAEAFLIVALTLVMAFPAVRRLRDPTTSAARSDASPGG